MNTVSTLLPMKGFSEQRAFRLTDFIPPHEPAFISTDTLAAEAGLLSTIDESAPGTLLVVDFQQVRVASEAARTLLRRALRRLSSGEIEDRFIVLTNLGDSEYNVAVMLSGEGLTAVERKDAAASELIGRIDAAVRETYEYLLSVTEGTASDLRDRLQMQNISTATNRLAVLAKLGIARRVEQRPAAGGGREFVYVAVR
jgi:hypothetical protein